MDGQVQDRESVVIETAGLQGLLGVPADPAGVVVFAHGSGSGRFSPRNNYVAEGLRGAGFATLLVDLLTESEEGDRARVFDIPLLTSRLIAATRWLSGVSRLAQLPVGYFGASTGAGAALLAAASEPARIGAIVSRGGRPDLAGSPALAHVRAPTQLIVGERDLPVIELNREAMRHLRCEHEIVIVPGAHHLFEEPGALDLVIGHATRWFSNHLAA
ncbi:MAG: dienelactone hydrolase family protein [Pseudomonadota bacterium]